MKTRSQRPTHRMLSTVIALAVALAAAVPISAVAQVAEAITDRQAEPRRAPAGCGQVQDYVPGTATAGEFAVSDCFSVNDGLRQPIDYWRFHTDGRRDIQVVVEAPGMAVRLRVLTAEQLLQRLADRHQLLSRAGRGAPEHQLTLRASIEYRNP